MLAVVIAVAVAAYVVQDARAQRVATGRAELAQANARLVDRALPPVSDPGPDATGDELLVQAARAYVLGDLPPAVTDLLRVDRPPLRLLPPEAGADDDADTSPSSVTTSGAAGPDQDSTDTAPGGPVLVEVPGPRPAPAAVAPRGPAPAAPAPAPAPAPRRGLLEPCLLGSILC